MPGDAKQLILNVIVQNAICLTFKIVKYKSECIVWDKEKHEND